MPFKSEKQRRYMHANLPKIAQRWEKKYRKGGRIKVNEGGYIGKAIRSEYDGVKLSNPSYFSNKIQNELLFLKKA